jgi:hypothetical protein
VLTGSRTAETSERPTPESIGLEIGLILAVTLGVAYAVPLILSVYGIE